MTPVDFSDWQRQDLTNRLVLILMMETQRSELPWWRVWRRVKLNRRIMYNQRYMLNLAELYEEQNREEEDG